MHKTLCALDEIAPAVGFVNLLVGLTGGWGDPLGAKQCSEEVEVNGEGHLLSTNDKQPFISQ